MWEEEPQALHARRKDARGGGNGALRRRDRARQNPAYRSASKYLLKISRPEGSAFGARAFIMPCKDSDTYARRHRTGAAAHNCKVVQKGLTPKQRYDIIETGNMGVANRRLAPWGKYDEYFLHKGVVVWILHSCGFCSTWWNKKLSSLFE